MSTSASRCPCTAARPKTTILKTVAGRGQDWVDLKRITQRSGRAMDWELVLRELEPLLEMTGQPESMDRLRGIVEIER